MIYFANYQFSEPEPLSGWKTSEKAGIYAILTKDSSARSRRYKVIYFGESGNLSDRDFLKSHEKHDCWLSQAGGSEDDLFIAVFPLPNSTIKLRGDIEAFLIRYYRPACNF